MATNLKHGFTEKDLKTATQVTEHYGYIHTQIGRGNRYVICLMTKLSVERAVSVMLKHSDAEHECKYLEKLNFQRGNLYE